MKKEEVETTVHESKCDQISAMFNMMMDCKREEKGTLFQNFNRISDLESVLGLWNKKATILCLFSTVFMMIDWLLVDSLSNHGNIITTSFYEEARENHDCRQF